MRNKQIDAIRGIFAMMVVFYHLFIRYIQVYVSPGKLFGIFDYFGTMGVTMFLLISAYFLVDHKDGKDKFSIKSFYFKKLKTLWPMYAVSIVLIFFITHLLNSPQDRLVELYDLVVNLLMVNGFVGIPYVDGAHWYITTLVKFIIVMGIIKKLGLENNYFSYLIWMCVAVGVKVIYIPIISALIGGPFVGMVAVSAALRYGFFKKDMDTKDKLMWGCVLLVGVLYMGVFNEPTRVIEVVIAIIILYLCEFREVKILNCKFLIYLGSISYLLYLIHQNISYGMINVLSKLSGGYNIMLSVFALVVSVLLASTLHLIFDRKVWKVGDKL